MGFLGLRRSKWKHADPDVRLRGVGELGESAQGTLVALALEDSEPRVRAAAAHRVVEAALLSRLSSQGDDAVRRIARERLSHAAGRLLKTQPLAACGSALDTVNDQKSLADLSLGATDPLVRSAAFAKLLGLAEPSQALLSTIAIQDARGDSGVKALSRITRRSSLRDIARKAKHASVRDAAQARANELTISDQRPSPERQRKARLQALEPLIGQATRLAVTSDTMAAVAELPLLAERWTQAMALAEGLDVEPAAKTLDDRFTRLRADIQRRADQERQRRDEARNARLALLADLAAAPVGSRSRAELTARWQALPALGDGNPGDLEQRFQIELARLTSVAPALPGPPAIQLPEAHAAELEALSAEAERLSTSDRFHDVMPQWHQLHKRWLSLAAPLPDGDPLKSRFGIAWSAFKQHRRDARAKRDVQRAEQLGVLRDLVAEAEALAGQSAGVAPDDQEGIRGVAARVRELQHRWKASGPAAAGPARQLRQAFSQACDRAYAPVAASREAEDWERVRHLGAAEELTASVRSLAEEGDLGVVVTRVKNAHRRWKSIGPLPRDRQQACWMAFKSACDEQFERCRPWLAEQDSQRIVNLARKRALVDELQGMTGQATVGLAGSPADLATRRAQSERAKTIQQEWRAIGPVPREADQELWRTYQKACDSFYGRMREQESVRRQEETANLDRKLTLCAQAEEFAARAETAKAGNTGLMTSQDIERRLRSLQDEWRAIGHVPRSEIEVVRSRFAAAGDRIAATIKPEREAAAAAESTNLEQKLLLIKEVEDILANPNPRWFKDEVKALSARWREIGDVPRERELELRRRFDELCRQVMRDA